MTQYRPPHEDWHDALPVQCTCEMAWFRRNIVDDRCMHHRMVEAIELLKAEGWRLLPPTTPEEAAAAEAVR